MAFTGKGKLIEELQEQTALTDTDQFVTGGSNANKITWANILAAIKAKILAWTFDTIGTTNKTIPGAINELKNKQDELNTKRSNAPATISEKWGIGHNVQGWGVIVPIVTNLNISTPTAEIYDTASGWHELTYNSQSAMAGTVYLVFKNTDASLEVGKSYLIRLTGEIKL